MEQQRLDSCHSLTTKASVSYRHMTRQLRGKIFLGDVSNACHAKIRNAGPAEETWTAACSELVGSLRTNSSLGCGGRVAEELATFSKNTEFNVGVEDRVVSHLFIQSHPKRKQHVLGPHCSLPPASRFVTGQAQPPTASILQSKTSRGPHISIDFPSIRVNGTLPRQIHPTGPSVSGSAAGRPRNSGCGPRS